MGKEKRSHSVFNRADGEGRGLPLPCADVGLEVSEVERAGCGGSGVVRATQLPHPGMLETLGGTQSATGGERERAETDHQDTKDVL